MSTLSSGSVTSFHTAHSCSCRGWQHAFLHDGKLSYRVPRPMRAGEWRRVVVRVSGTDPPPAFEQDFPGEGPVATRKVQVGSDLVAVLGGIDFEIRRVGGGDGRRTLLTGNFAEWQWDVRALRSGSLQLDLVLFVRVRDGGAPLLVRTFSEHVQVHVNPRYSVARWSFQQADDFPDLHRHRQAVARLTDSHRSWQSRRRGPGPDHSLRPDERRRDPRRAGGIPRPLPRSRQHPAACPVMRQHPP
jgi:hypothetical protein